MNFDLSEDEEMLKALAERFVADSYDMDRRRSYLAQPHGFSAQNWSMLGDLGLISALGDGEEAGFNLDATAIATVFEALGRGLVIEPLIENVLVAMRLFAATASETLRAEWMPGLNHGTRRIALAHAEPKSRPGLIWVETTVQADGDGLVLNGTKSCVPGGGGVDGYIVTARHEGAAISSEGLGLYLVPANAAGLMLEDWRMADGSLASTVSLNAVTLDPAMQLNGGFAALDAAETTASLARSAEALGIMERLFAETQDYLRTRDQSGAKLASFQAIQHRMVAQYAAIEQSRALLNLAMVSWGQPEFAAAVMGARAFIAPASVELGHEMIQFHGGMGVTDELSIGHGHKRLLVLSRWPDSPEIALDRFAKVA